MQAARYYENQDIRIDDIEAPTPEAGEVLIDVAACGICGSDLKEYLNGPKHYGDDHLPYTMGHEIGGTVVEAGDGVDVEVGTDVALNPLVACRDCWCCDDANYNICRNLSVVGANRQGGYAEMVTAPAGNVIPLPDGITPETAAVAEPVTVAFHAAMQSPLRAGESAAVVGLGPIGLGLIQVAKAMGADPVYASGHREARRERAERCGADAVIDPRETDPVERFSAGLDGGVDVSFEVAGTESALTTAIGVTKPGGHTTLVGVYEDAVEMHPMALVNPERSLSTAAGYRTGPHADAEFGPVLDGFADGSLNPDPLVTARVDLADIVEEGFEALADRESGHVKVLVRP